MTNGLTAQELTTYLLCPQKYEFEHVTELTGDTRQERDRFQQLLRKTICTGYSEARSNGVDPRDGAIEALDVAWDLYADAVNLHSSEQESTEKIRAEAGVDAYFDAIGTTHLEQIEQAAAICGSPVIGPDITLTATINGNEVGTNVDYIIATDNQIVGVRLTDTLWGSRVPWENKTEIAKNHLERGDYKPEQVGTVLSARIAEEALNEYSSDGTGAELMYLSVMETTFESADGCDAEIDYRRMGGYLSDTRETIDEAIAWMNDNIADKTYSPVEVFNEQEHWDGSFRQVVENTCQNCSHAAGCEEAVSREMMFDV
ncbi:hypothetical protein [Halococcus agarilyticus]|uniref:hypothetical protein n=1 Tax=Halococcus agarilyticus TaxID=1232219 RepID=UPI000677E4D4|nr:hypothetical protein [Halococcus agarilyticus]